MEAVSPLPLEFNVDGIVAFPSSPQRRSTFFYFSAPSSPSRASNLQENERFPGGVPFRWEEKPGTPKSNQHGDEENDFEFNFSGETYRPAEELFEKGKIRPLKPPPGYDYSSQSSSPRTPSSTKDFDPFQAALEQARKRESESPLIGKQERGRETTNSSRKKGGSRSLSPLRVSDDLFHDGENIISDSPRKRSYTASIISAFSFSPKGNRKWKLRDLLLFRSASEGRANAGSSIFNGGGRDTSMRRYTALSRKDVFDDIKNSSFRSSDSSIGGSFRKTRSSAELHYTVNRAVSEELKRKTPLPYKQGLLGCLGLVPHNPTTRDLITRQMDSLARSR